MSHFAELLNSIEFSSKKHRDQRRLDTHASPYINHPIAVATLLARCGIDDIVVLKSAVLHDVIEDTLTTTEELVKHAGAQVTEVVLEVSDDKTLDKAERKRLQIEHASSLSYEASLVKIADKTCNLLDVANNPPKNWSLQRRLEYFTWAKAVVDNLVDVPPALRAEFDLAYSMRPSEDVQ